MAMAGCTMRVAGRMERPIGDTLKAVEAEKSDSIVPQAQAPSRDISKKGFPSHDLREASREGSQIGNERATQAFLCESKQERETPQRERPSVRARVHEEMGTVSRGN